MNTYFFILGRTPELSRVEIKSVLSSQKITFEEKELSKEVMLIQTEREIDTHTLNKKLGGTVKMGRVVAEVEYDPQFSNLLSLITKDFLVEHFFQNTERKVHFGISVYGLNDSANVTKLSKKISHFQIAIKQLLELWGIRSHYPRIQAQKLSSASVKKNKLITHGSEIVLLTDLKVILVCKTDAVQEFEQFSKRDYGRPVRDMQSGVLPPKLARMMINLSEKGTNGVLLDPFCGSGTVLQEALVLGFRNIIGTDISEKAISDSKKNIEWYLQNKESEKPNVEIFQSDVKHLSSKLREPIDVIVGEPYLGETLHSFPTVNDAVSSIRNLEKLYLRAFAEFAQVLNKGGVVVIVLPVINTKRGYKYTNIFKEIEKLGLRIFSLSNTQRGTIVVGDRRDFVLREVVKCIRK